MGRRVLEACQGLRLDAVGVEIDAHEMKEPYGTSPPSAAGAGGR
jgi:hypothetical protein